MIIDILNTEAKSYIDRLAPIVASRGLRAATVTFGCQQNEADSERIMGLLAGIGYTPEENPERADLVIVNTCAIREHAEAKALSLLGRFKKIRERNPDFILGVVGCMAAEAHRVDSLKKDFHYVSFTAPPGEIHKLPELIYTALTARKRGFARAVETPDIIEGVRPIRKGSHRAWVSVMYGCNNFCSYCIVPYVRGRERSRASADVIRECRELIDSGVREITLLGQNVNSYRSDMSFAELLANIAQISGDFIIRFMTSHPKDTSDELIEVMSKYKKIAPHFHLPLQSGSNRILSLMNRTYTVEKYLDTVKKLRLAVPNVALSTDIIVGFPSEGDADFMATLSVLSAVKFDMVYSFIYSPRVGTRAAKMSERVDGAVAGERMERLLSLQDGISRELTARYVGHTVRALVDSVRLSDGGALCTARADSGRVVHFSTDRARVGEFVNVKIKSASAFDLFGDEV